MGGDPERMKGMDTLHQLEEKLDYHFHDPALLRGALYHSSYANEHRNLGIRSNERLEFLGDAVLGFVSAEFLYVQYILPLLSVTTPSTLVLSAVRLLKQESAV